MAVCNLIETWKLEKCGAHGHLRNKHFLKGLKEVVLLFIFIKSIKVKTLILILLKQYIECLFIFLEVGFSS